MPCNCPRFYKCGTLPNGRQGCLPDFPIGIGGQTGIINANDEPESLAEEIRRNERAVADALRKQVSIGRQIEQVKAQRSLTTALSSTRSGQIQKFLLLSVGFILIVYAITKMAKG